MRCQAMTVSGLTMRNAERQSFHNVRAKPTELGQRSGVGVYDHGWNAVGPCAVAGEQESLLAERRGRGNNLVFNVNGLFDRDRRDEGCLAKFRWRTQEVLDRGFIHQVL